MAEVSPLGGRNKYCLKIQKKADKVKTTLHLGAAVVILLQCYLGMIKLKNMEDNNEWLQHCENL